MLNAYFLSRNLSSVSWGLLTPLLGELIHSPDLAQFYWIRHVSLGRKAEMQIKLTRQKGVYWLVTRKSPRIVFAPSTSGPRSTFQGIISFCRCIHMCVYMCIIAHFSTLLSFTSPTTFRHALPLEQRDSGQQVQIWDSFRFECIWI